MAGGRNYYSIETRAHRDGYTVGDVDGKMCRYANDGTRLPQDRIPKPDHLVDFNVNNSAICGPSEDETSTSSTEPPSPALGPGKADASPLTIPDDLSQVDGSDDSIKKPKRSVDNSTQKQKRPLKQPTLTSNVENWSTCQPLLDPTISPFLIYQRWTAALNKPGSSLSATASTTANKEGADFIDVRISTDAGRYLCEYIYYASLAHCNVKSAVRGKEPQANVLFLHVPGDADQAAVEKGVHVTVELIKAAVFELDQTEKSRALGRMVRGGEGRKGSVRTVSSAAGSLTSLVGEMKALKVEEWLALSPDDDGDASGRLTGDGEAR